MPGGPQPRRPRCSVGGPTRDIAALAMYGGAPKLGAELDKVTTATAVVYSHPTSCRLRLASPVCSGSSSTFGLPCNDERQSWLSSWVVSKCCKLLHRCHSPRRRPKALKKNSSAAYNQLSFMYLVPCFTSTDSNMYMYTAVPPSFRHQWGESRLRLFLRPPKSKFHMDLLCYLDQIWVDVHDLSLNLFNHQFRCTK